MSEKYLLKYGETGEWKEVSKLEWVRAERAAGFRPKLPFGHPEWYLVCATAGFGGIGVQGKIVYEKKD